MKISFLKSIKIIFFQSSSSSNAYNFWSATLTNYHKRHCFHVRITHSNLTRYRKPVLCGFPGGSQAELETEVGMAFMPQIYDHIAKNGHNCLRKSREKHLTESAAKSTKDQACSRAWLNSLICIKKN